MQKIKRFLTPENVTWASIALAVIAVTFTYVYTSRRPSVAYILPLRTSITEEVDATGTIKPAENVDLSFDTAGRISSVSAPVGTKVYSGQVLATLSGSDQAAALAQARAALDVQEAKLAGLKAGTRSEDVAVSQAAVDGAKSAVSNAKEIVVASAQDAYVKADDAIHNRVDQFITNPRGTQPILSVTFTDSSLQNSVQSERVSIEPMIAEWKSYSSSLDPATSEVSDITTKTRANVRTISTYLDSIAGGLSNLTPSATLPLSTIQKYQSDIATGRTNLSAALTSINQAETAERAAESALASAQSQLLLKQAGATPTDIQAQEAQVAAAEANVQAALSQVNKTVIRSPISGTVSKNDAHVGATASPGMPLLSVISATKYQVESYISEADVAKVKVGDLAQVTLDAYSGNGAFQATIIAVDPVSTIQNGVPSYKITLQFINEDAKIQAGLTANVKIVSALKNNVLTIPTSAIITQGTEQYVLKSNGSSEILQKVTIGAQSVDGKTEIISGLDEMSKIRTFGEQ